MCKKVGCMQKILKIAFKKFDIIICKSNSNVNGLKSDKKIVIVYINYQKDRM